jgi:hypothetical protein
VEEDEMSESVPADDPLLWFWSRPHSSAGTEGPGLRYPVELRCAELEEALKELADACDKLPASDARVIGLIPIIGRARDALAREGEKK